MIVLFIFILGLAIGSFLNVCIDRLPAEESLNGRSHCDHCKKKLGILDLVPVLSYFMLRGKCRYCNKKLSLFYPFVEVLTGVAFVLVCFYSISVISTSLQAGRDLNHLLLAEIPQSLRFFGMTGSLLVLISSLIVIFFADLKYHIIPDEATIAIILFSIPFTILNSPATLSVISNPHTNGVRNLIPLFMILLSHLGAGLILFAILCAIYYGSIFFMKKEGMGFGDVKLAFAMGLLLGLKGGLIALYLSFVIGGLLSVLLILFGKKGMKSMIAFGPFMIVGILVMLFLPEKIMSIIRLILPI